MERNASFGSLVSQSSNDPSMMEVRPPMFLHGFGRAQSRPRPSPNAGRLAGGTLPQPFPQTATQNDVARGSTSLFELNPDPKILILAQSWLILEWIFEMLSFD